MGRTKNPALERLLNGSGETMRPKPAKLPRAELVAGGSDAARILRHVLAELEAPQDVLAHLEAIDRHLEQMRPVRGTFLRPAIAADEWTAQRVRVIQAIGLDLHRKLSAQRPDLTPSEVADLVMELTAGALGLAPETASGSGSDSEPADSKAIYRGLLAEELAKPEPDPSLVRLYQALSGEQTEFGEQPPDAQPAARKAGEPEKEPEE